MRSFYAGKVRGLITSGIGSDKLRFGLSINPRYSSLVFGKFHKCKDGSEFLMDNLFDNQCSVFGGGLCSTLTGPKDSLIDLGYSSSDSDSDDDTNSEDDTKEVEETDHLDTITQSLVDNTDLAFIRYYVRGLV